MEKEFDELLAKVTAYNSTADVELLQKAWDFAKVAHAGQKRLTGESYVSHALAVTQTLAEWKLDTATLTAGLIHDTASLGAANQRDLVKEFGEEITGLVNAVTKITDVRLRGSREESFIENLRKMLLVIAKDLRAIFIKLADRIHNMQTLYALPVSKQKENAIETLEMYAPLAERLGIGGAKGKLEDLAFPYAYSRDYERVKKESRAHYKNAERDIERMKALIHKNLTRESVESEIHGRKKRLYSLWRKLERPEIAWDFEQVHDIVALRILVDSVIHCYTALGVVHGLFKPVPSIGISDFVAQPKPNGYRSIHTKVFGPGRRIVEVQIRTFDMHEEAEHGAAAHWAYGEAKSQGVSDRILEKSGVKVRQDKLNWVKQLVEWQKQISDSQEFVKVVKFDALSHRNFIFSPQGDVYDLPTGATPVDFAYAVHSDLGNYVTGAKVNGKVVPLSSKLSSGDVVEIMKSKNPKPPTKDWLEFVVTGQARKHIMRKVRSHE